MEEGAGGCVGGGFKCWWWRGVLGSGRGYG